MAGDEFTWPFVSLDNDTFLYLAALQIAMLAILVTSYIFLSTVVRKRESLEYSQLNTIETMHLVRIRVIMVSFFSVIVAILMHFEYIRELESKFISTVLFWASLCIQGVTLLFMISIMAHRLLFVLVALRGISRGIFKKPGCQKDRSEGSTKIFQKVSYLEQMVRQVNEGHANQLEDYFSQSDKLMYILD